ncbi:Glyoxalase-like domain-containing protein [Streptoalloteichus tenebrarius]|uniref:Glyoxalase-like domain-containing protein n=1 Tax=Streptoalloteichus tenebrarius (strain ATCC 17920 / DSM 40477 / JCM 4838 / CBS 697.72 / NBRC 16177 / NCIMB 11028 / NRRL B-12390 / A12253. 1 / ISP 5477) TaxID=1933 RepID=A0ABT1HMX6_STRSD|nr:VOC family protein [Streptoalloteichus tenebrarius]MCP2256881.1 Glyoxalase-like domain-containing protein [Streptoalloteichus tenebrarius]BFF00212.1 VOC family protein [Streptoalloteichus tenebrarius]
MSLALKMVTIDCLDPHRLAEFWTRALGASVVGDWGGFLVLGVEGAPALGLQRVPEPRAGKNRVHLDFAADDREAEVRRLEELGATRVTEHSAPGLAWTVLADPEGNEFCVSDPVDHA